MTNAERQKLWEARKLGDYSEGFLPGVDDEGDSSKEPINTMSLDEYNKWIAGLQKDGKIA